MKVHDVLFMSTVAISGGSRLYFPVNTTGSIDLAKHMEKYNIRLIGIFSFQQGADPIVRTNFT